MRRDQRINDKDPKKKIHIISLEIISRRRTVKFIHQLDVISLDECDWHILAGNYVRIVYCLT